MERRKFLTLLLGGAGLATLGLTTGGTYMAEAAEQKDMVMEPIKKIELSQEEWKKRLTPEQYEVLRKEGTERPGSSPLEKEKREGVFACAGCDLPLFESKTKFDSGTGWPSFYDITPGHFETKRDYKTAWLRKEYHCARCGGHQGHIFEDGPQPTGLRYCNNGVALKFIPKGA